MSPNVKLQSSCGWFIDESCEPNALLILKAAQNDEVKGGDGVGCSRSAGLQCQFICSGAQGGRARSRRDPDA